VRPNPPREANKIKLKIGIFIECPIAARVIASEPKPIESLKSKTTE